MARPAVGFKDLKERLDARLKWLGIKVNSDILAVFSMRTYGMRS